MHLCMCMYVCILIFVFVYVFVACVYGFKLTTFYWTSKGPHQWENPIIPHPVVIICF